MDERERRAQSRGGPSAAVRIDSGPTETPRDRGAAVPARTGGRAGGAAEQGEDGAMRLYDG